MISTSTHPVQFFSLSLSLYLLCSFKSLPNCEAVQMEALKEVGKIIEGYVTGNEIRKEGRKKKED